jgi:predicted DNA-binding protein (UPF0251 family)
MDPESSASYAHGAEEWRPVPGHEGRYEVSDFGRVRSLRRVGRQPHGSYDKPRREPLVMRLSTTPDGYHAVDLASRSWTVHVLVLEAFVGPRPPEHEGAHLNGNPGDNRPSNLAWVTSAENKRHSLLHGTFAVGDRNGARQHPERLARGERQGAYTHPETVRRGEQHHRAKLTAEQVIAMREAAARGVPQHRLAELYQLNRRTVQRIVHRLAWAHVP